MFINRHTTYYIVITSAIILLLIAPHIYALLVEDTNSQFLGITGLYPKEQFYYLSVSATQSLKDGSWLFSDKYNRVEATGVFVNPIGNFIYLIATLLPFSLAQAFSLYVLMSSALLLWSYIQLSKCFVKSVKLQILGLCLYVFGSGIGYLSEQFALHIHSIDLSAPALNMFLAMQGEFYHPVANALLLICLRFTYEVLHKQQPHYLKLTLSVFALGWIYIYALVLYITIAFIYLIYIYLQRSKCNSITVNFTATVVVATLLPLCYYVWLAFRVIGTNDDNWVYVPDIETIFGTYFFAIIPALAFVLLAIVLGKKQYALLFIWFITTLALLYLPFNLIPFNFQMLTGFGAVCSICAVLLYEKIFNKVRGLSVFSTLSKLHLFTLFILLYITLFSTSNAYLYLQQLHSIKNNDKPYFITKNIYDGFTWSYKNLKSSDNILIDNDWSLYFAGISGCNVYSQLKPDDVITTPIMDYRLSEQYLKNCSMDSLSRLAKEKNVQYGVYFKNYKQTYCGDLDPYVVFKNDEMFILRLNTH